MSDTIKGLVLVAVEVVTETAIESSVFGFFDYRC
jgi:hypothetical protein